MTRRLALLTVAVAATVALLVSAGTSWAIAARAAEPDCERPRAEEIASAVEAMAAAREIHVNWAQWQEATPNWRELVTPESPGGPEHHRRWVAAYDRVLDVLRRADCG